MGSNTRLAITDLKTFLKLIVAVSKFKNLHDPAMGFHQVNRLRWVLHMIKGADSVKINARVQL
jgi:hypothetical protein